MDKENAIAKLVCIVSLYQYKLNVLTTFDVDCCVEHDIIKSNVKKALNYIFILRYGCDYNYDDILCFIDDHYSECNNTIELDCDVSISIIDSVSINCESTFELEVMQS